LTVTGPDDHDADSLICSHAFHRDRPVLFVYREADGFWTFTCGQSDHLKKQDVLPVCHCCALAENGLADDLGDLPKGYEARRSSSSERWRISPTPTTQQS